MSINVLARKMLWSRSGNRCAFRNCSVLLTMDLGDAESQLLGEAGAVIGEEAHIRSSKTDGPRHVSEYKNVDGYQNLLLLCPNHHTMIDKNDGATFSIEDLTEMKMKHEQDIERMTGPEGSRRRELEERMTASLVIWEQKCDLWHWEHTSWLLHQPTPQVTRSATEKLTDLGAWLLARHRLVEFPQITQAWENLGYYVGLLARHIYNCFEPIVIDGQTTPIYEMRKEHKELSGWNAEAYRVGINEFFINSATCWWLVREITKSINLVVDVARGEVSPFYRFDEGVILMGDVDGMSNIVVRVEYDSEQRRTLSSRFSLDELKSALWAEAELRNVDPSQVNLDAVRPGRKVKAKDEAGKMSEG